MTGSKGGVAAKLREHQSLKDLLMFTVYVIVWHWPVQAQVTKRLNIYLKTACNMHNMETLPDNKRKNVAKKVKKAVNRRWFSLHASVDGVCEEYNGLLEKFSIL